MVKHKKILSLLLLTVFVFSLAGCGVMGGAKKTPLETLVEAQENMKNLKGIKEKITVQNDDNTLGLGMDAESIVTYEFDKEKGYVETNTDGDIVSLYITKDAIYLKDGETDQYINLTGSLVGDMMLTMVNFAELNDEYKKFNEQIMNTVEEDDVTMEDAEITVNGKQEKVKKISLTLSEDKIRDIYAEYIESMAKKIMTSLTEDLADFQIEMEQSITGEEMSEEEKESVKKGLQEELDRQLKEQVDSIEFSDLVIVFYIKDGIILKKEESYTMKVDGKESKSKTVIEVLEYGDDVKCPEIPEDKIISLDEYMEFQLDGLEDLLEEAEE